MRCHPSASAIRWAIRSKLAAAGESGRAMTVGVPASPSPMISASKGTSPRYGTARSSLRALPPPTPNRPVVLGNAEHRDVERREHLGGFTGFGGRDARRLRHNYSTRELDCLRQTQRNVSRPWWKIHD